jgi:hypothetical protein
MFQRKSRLDGKEKKKRADRVYAKAGKTCCLADHRLFLFLSGIFRKELLLGHICLRALFILCVSPIHEINNPDVIATLAAFDFLLSSSRFPHSIGPIFLTASPT